jgi:hypothetical protein
MPKHISIDEHYTRMALALSLPGVLVSPDPPRFATSSALPAWDIEICPALALLTTGAVPPGKLEAGNFKQDSRLFPLPISRI